MIKQLKYYLLILDTRCDVSHTEQLTNIVKFVYHNKNTNIAETRQHVLGFQPVVDTTGHIIIRIYYKSFKINEYYHFGFS